MLVAALCNQKGGVGKTTSAVNLSRAAYLRGMRTLIVDMDPQGNTTKTVLGTMPAPGVETLADVLSARSNATVKDVIVATGWAGVNVLPSGSDALADVGGELVGMGPGREHRLREALDEIGADYELALIDCPPSLDLLSINALTAADRLVIVTAASQFSLDGIARLLKSISSVKRYSNSDVTIAGIIANAVEDRTRRQRHWLSELRANVTQLRLGDELVAVDVWNPPIPKATWIAEAQEAGMGLDEWGTPPATVMSEVYDGYLTKLLEAGQGSSS